jgi:putative flippase GtrA
MRLSREYLVNYIIKSFRFGIMSFIAMVVNFTVSIGGHKILGMSPNLSYALALVFVSTTTFFMCRYFVYRTAAHHAPIKQYGKFILSTISFRGCEYAVFWILFNIVGIWYLWAIIIVAITSTIIKFFFYDAFIFGQKPDLSG